ncbi:MAG: PIN domain-containing protein [Verrucomicrobiota bacterium JB022]|nr:PIN domain-containing protein [Verrucomicrobiota bacterium JB022]
MLAIDTNILFYAFAAGRPEHPAALAWLKDQHTRSDVVISEFVLVEFYRLLRNATLLDRPKSASEAAAIIQHYRQHPSWRTLGFNQNSQLVHDRLWERAASQTFSTRAIFDVRLAISLQDHGVDELATRNVRDFEAMGFRKVFDPLASAQK